MHVCGESLDFFGGRGRHRSLFAASVAHLVGDAQGLLELPPKF